MHHKLKLNRRFIQAVFLLNVKRFEIRRNDRDFEIGDTIEFIDPETSTPITKHTIFKIIYVLKDCPEYGMDNNYCIFQFE